ncbi:LacI family DNA-binding transcriptional regulator [Agromyces kandeliae]|uniref:LacI family DNA-binding transcriptional regulator n=1 Tax=Agromyces kandeliae TaxID=2666141 RepID=A0A6L5R715_9MICO|nr:LacI family DNA-binding transcriptional regulator [Agromyces kandeliae]MRX45238.1 LacI family DNA-binding transcriptional regulator [Agromyces kandeliae]
MSEVPTTRQPERASIRDVAVKAGVSRQTVVRAMNDMPGISADTKAHVLRVARELRYRPSRFGRGLAKQDTLTVGLVVSDLTNAYFAELASEFIAVAGEVGWTVLVQEIERDKQHEKRVLSSFATQVDAIVGYLLIDDAELDDLVGDLPVVRFADLARGGHRPMIGIDYEPGMSAALDHLTHGGRRHILMVDVPTEAGPSPRAEVFRRLSAARGLATTIVELPDEHLPRTGAVMAFVAQALETHPETDAIVGFNDMIAVGALKQLVSAGVAVPERCAVLGIDGLLVGELVTPSLSTLEFDMRMAARMLFEAMLAALSDPHPAGGTGPVAIVTHTLTVRESTATA